MNAQTLVIDLRDLSVTMMRRFVGGLLFALLLLSATISLASADGVGDPRAVRIALAATVLAPADATPRMK